MNIDSGIAEIVKRDRWVVLAGLCTITALAWLYMLDMAGSMAVMDRGSVPDMAMASPRPWDAAHFLMMFVMWAVMMVAMMVPSAAPMILLYNTVVRNKNGGAPPFLYTTLFTGGYLLVWSLFSIAATGLQWELHGAALLSPMMTAASPYLGGAVLIAAGAYQWTSLKHACLSHCRSPLEHLSSHWRPGRAGALIMGAHHGTYCLGCCWLLMGLLFVLGVMNLLWVAAIALFVLLEKVVPNGLWFGRISGVLMGLWGLVLIGTA